MLETVIFSKNSTWFRFLLFRSFNSKATHTPILKNLQLTLKNPIILFPIYLNKDTPVISVGLSIPKSSRIVGAISHNLPVLLSLNSLFELIR